MICQRSHCLHLLLATAGSCHPGGRGCKGQAERGREAGGWAGAVLAAGGGRGAGGQKGESGVTWCGEPLTEAGVREGTHDTQDPHCSETRTDCLPWALALPGMT